jgi:4-amino-4-deoxy-L-arabinose transferase-like glycosyltransferase
LNAAAERGGAVATKPLCALAAGFFALQLIPLANDEYGWFIDEFYYFACAKRLDWGYVDHPPLSIFLLRLVVGLFGESIVAARSVAAACGAATVLLTGVTAQRLGATRYGQLLAAAAVASAPVLIAVSGFYSMNAIEILLWSGASLVLVEILTRDEPQRWWLAGVLLGLALLNKHTVALFAAGLAVGLLASGRRALLLDRRLWLGVALAALIASPNLLWQVAHDWASLDFYRSASTKNAATSPLRALVNQLLSFNPGALPIYGTGAFALLRSRRLRPLGITVAGLLLVIVLTGQSRPDRIAGILPLATAAGAAFWDRFDSRPLRLALPALPLAIAIALSPVFLPILPPAALARYAAMLGAVPEIEAHDAPLALPQWFADRLDWPEYVRAVEAAVATLPEEERAHAIVLTRFYGGASPLELLGRDLPPVHSLHNAYHTWGPPGAFEVAVTVQFGEQDLARHFESVTRIGEFQCTWCRQWRRPTPIFAVRRPRRPIDEIWSEVGIYH